MEPAVAFRQNMKLKNWQRLAQMEPEELRDRVRQELHKRQDGIFARLGFDFARNSRSSSDFKRGNFFFGPESIDTRLKLLRERLPGQAEQIVQQAEKICQHRFDL